MRWLVVRSDRLGDVVLAFPALHYLRQQRPEDELHFMVRAPFVPLAELSAEVDRVHSIDPRAPLGQLQRQFRQLDCDVAIVGNANVRLAWALRRAGISWVAGNGRRWFSPLFSHRLRLSRSRRGLHEADTLRALVRCALGPGAALPGNPRLGWRLDPHLMQQAAERWRAIGCATAPIVLQPGSLGSSMDWPPEQMVALAQQLRQRGHAVAMHLGPMDQHLAPQCQDLPCFGADLSLRDLAASLASARAMVSNSTGPLHLAAALNTPVVALHPRVQGLHPRRWGPVATTQRRMLMPPGPDYPNRASCPENHMAGITLDRVITAVEELL